MSKLVREIESRITAVKKELEISENWSKQLPEGHLRVTGYQKPRYYQVIESGDVSGKYVSEKEIELVKGLAQKRYNQKVSALLKKELSILERARLFYSRETMKIDHEDADFFSGPEELIYAKLSKARQELVEPIVLDQASFIRSWTSQKYERMPFAEFDPEYYTEGGVRVRRMQAHIS